MGSLPIDVVMAILSRVDETSQAVKLAMTCRLYSACFYHYDLHRRVKSISSHDDLFRVAVQNRDPIVLKADLKGNLTDITTSLPSSVVSTHSSVASLPSNIVSPKSIYALRIFSSPGRLLVMQNYIQRYESQWKGKTDFEALCSSTLAFINERRCLEEFQWLLHYLTSEFIEKGPSSRRLTAFTLAGEMTKSVYSLPLDVFMAYEPLLMEFIKRNQLGFRTDLAFAAAEKYFQQQLP
jgi:hypothetical protein